MKSFLKFILFVIVWCVFYYFIGRAFNWGLDLLSNALNLDTFIGKLILVSVCSSVLWGILFYPTILMGSFFINKSIYAIFSMILMIIYNVALFFAYVQLDWYMLIIWLFHAGATIIPTWGIWLQLKNAERELKAQQEEEYKEKLKEEIIESLKQ